MLLVQYLTSDPALPPGNIDQAPLRVDAAHRLLVNVAAGSLTVSPQPAVISVGNSSTTPLGANAIFTGSWEDLVTGGYVQATVIVDSDKSSATNGFIMQLSEDGVTVDRQIPYTFTAGTNNYFGIPREARYFRVVYTNGNQAQTTFRLQTILNPVVVGQSIAPIDYAIGTDTTVNLTRSVITGQTTGGGGGFVNVKVNPSGALVTASNIFDSNGANLLATNAPVGNESTLPVYPLAQVVKKQTFTVNTAGDNTVYTPAAGKAVKLLWYSYTSDAGNGSATKVILKAGTTAIDTQSLSASQPFAHTIGGGRGFYDAGTNTAIVVNLSANNTVYVNLEWLEY